MFYCPDYADHLLDQLLKEVQNQLDKNVATLEAATKRAQSLQEDLSTRCFLSHKRATAQAIAGRLYEGLKK